MRFYSNSTQQKVENFTTAVPQRVLPKLDQLKPLNQQQSHQNICYFNHYCRELLEVSSVLNVELLRNRQLIDIYNQNQAGSGKRGLDRSLKDTSDYNSTASGKNNSGEDGKDSNKQTEKILSTHQPKRKRKREKSSEDEYVPEYYEVNGEDPTGTKASQSKNIPKAYSKAIMRFIMNNQNYTLKVLSRLNLDYEQFLECIKIFRSQVCSIGRLQWLWNGSDNKFAKAFRILSTEYLRKYSLGYIFNSRVNIYSKHIKYRYKMMESVGDPDNFTCMKEF